ncbi:MAG: C40 family peptidase, partial [Actinobacteria bacterium]|nr:C40 family peptidase [Actinomycetota bacterium]
QRPRRVRVEQQAAIVVAQSQQQVKQAQQTVNQTQAQLTAAEATYATTALGRAKYTQYEQAYASYQQQMAQLAAERAAAAAAAAAARARQQQQQNNGGGGGNNSGGGGGGVSGGGGPPPSGGSWTAAAGQQAANRALSWLGEPYIWAGGNQWGPTDGGCTDPIAPCGTLGFDCSGLVLYAWAQGWAHYAATQYWQAGSYHPSPGNFMPGDLLFWSEDGTEGGIGHVAIYIGNGNVVQAPESGDVVKITPWDEVESGYYGATRPLT